MNLYNKTIKYIIKKFMDLWNEKKYFFQKVFSKNIFFHSINP